MQKHRIVSEEDLNIVSLSSPDTILLTEEEDSLLRILSPASYHARTGEAVEQNEFFQHNLGFETFREAITLDNTLGRYKRGENTNAKIVEWLKTNSKLPLINKYAQLGGKEEIVIDEQNPVKTIYEMKTTMFSVVQDAFEAIRKKEGVNEHTLQPIKEPLEEHEQIITNTPRLIIDALMLYGSADKWLKNNRQGEKPSDYDTRIIVSHVDHKIYNFIHSRNQRSIDGVPISMNIIPSEYFEGVSFFDNKNFNSETTVLEGAITYQAPVTKKTIALTNNVGTLLNQRGFLAENDDETMLGYIRHPAACRRVIARLRGGEEAFLELSAAGYELEKPVVLKNMFHSDMSALSARNLIARSSLELTDMLKSAYQQH